MRDLRIVALDGARWPEAEDIWAEAWAETFPDIDFTARRAWIAQKWAMSAAGGLVWRAAIGDDLLLGFYCLEPASGYIDQIVVRRSAWGRGVGAALIDDAKARRPHGLALTVNQDNPRAVRFYEAQGFRRGAAGVAASGLLTWDYVWSPETARAPCAGG